MSDHKQVLKDTILNFIKNNKSEIDEETFELKYGSETLLIETKPRVMHFEDLCYGNRLYIKSIDNYNIGLEEVEKQFLNLPTLNININCPHIKSPSYYEVIDIIKQVDLVVSGNTRWYKWGIPDIEPKYLVLWEADVKEYAEKSSSDNPKTTIIYDCMFDDLKENIDLINQLKCRHVMIDIWPYNVFASDKFLSVIQKIDHTITIHIGNWFKAMKKYITDNRDVFAKHENLTKIQYDGDDKIIEVYNRTEYLDMLNLRRMQLHYHKSQNLQHPLANRNITKLIGSFLY